MFYLQNAMSCDIIPDKLTCTLTGGVFRFLNKGDEYKHYLTSAFVSGSLNAYLGRWVISAYADNGWKFVEGETQAHHGSYVFLKRCLQSGKPDFVTLLAKSAHLPSAIGGECDTQSIRF